MTSDWAVHKFGGTSVGDAEGYRRASAILEADGNSVKKAIVVSAMAGVTDALIELVGLAKTAGEDYLSRADALKARHTNAIKTLLPSERWPALTRALESNFRDIKDVLRGVYLSKACSDRTLEFICGHGELWSAQLLSAHLNAIGVASTWVDARTLVIVEDGDTVVSVDWELTRSRTDEWLKTLETDWVVVTGFIASTREGVPTTLRRNGSDFSASILGKLLNARVITIWTDVDGVLSADPRLVPEATVLEHISYQEATELAYFGAKVLHPSTMAPAIENQIPIWIRNTFNPSSPGTKIHNKASNGLAVKGFSTVEGMAVINLEGTGMIGVPGVANRLFGALREVGVSVVMISQASSEHSICFAIPEVQADLARKTVERAFFAELHHNQIQMIGVTHNCSIVAAVGDNMVDHPGIAGKFFSALGKAQVNIRAIAQGSSERNISAVINRADSRKALRAVHAAFYLSNQTISIGVIGSGLIGGTFLDQLKTQMETLNKEFKIDLRVRGILNSKAMVLNEKGRSLENWRDCIKNSGLSPDLENFVDHVQSDHFPHAAIVDCTASAEIATHYPCWLERGIHIITPNKKANTGTMEFYRKLRSLSRDKNRHYFYETTVGAGLPIISTLRDLIQTGDELFQIEAVLSGTLSYIFNTFDGTKPFSELVREARRKGYTEPDPREDLSGTDVGRKLVILAREIGLDLELEDIGIESLVPESLRGGSVEDFFRGLAGHDHVMTDLLNRSRDCDQVIRYVGVVDPEKECVVQLKNYPRSHVFARATGSDNIVAFKTQRYHPQPLIVQGPGAGPDVTAGGVFADLLRLASYLGGSA
jgi:bifunctional aspartokinase / homoserine dehydrogenase 1